MIKTFILAAGFGTRLRPLTYQMPKALLPVCGKPVIHYIFNHIKEVGVKEVVINLHYLQDLFKKALGDGSQFDLKINYSYEKDILDTGGGLKKVEGFLGDDTFIMYNCDILTNVNLKEMLDYHKKNKNKITLLASRSHTAKCLVVNEKGNVIAINRQNNEGGANYTFCGIHIIDPFIFKHIPPFEKVSIIDIYRTLISENIPISVFPLESAFWQEIGSIKSYKSINKMDLTRILP